ncbi:hypothetical protein [Chitinimonas sp.]|uniref:hypothetical protein n=1 Tax=Chitinimonas sp. TaxID=1934313 RepID=UPI0035AF9C9C
MSAISVEVVAFGACSVAILAALCAGFVEQAKLDRAYKIAEIRREKSNAAFQAALRKLSGPCEWKPHEGAYIPGTWRSACGLMWTFMAGGPTQYGFAYCPKCGKRAAIAKAEGVTA